MPNLSRFLLAPIVLACTASIALASGDDNSTKGIVIFKADFSHVATPYVVCVWVLAASIAKLGMNKQRLLYNLT